jgi:hypothetical protein
MQMLQIHYKGKRPRTILLLLLSMNDDYITGLEAQKVTDSDRTVILESKTVSVDWLKKHCPVSYQKAYRKLHTNKSRILDTHEIGR